MTDAVSKMVRSRIMSSIRGKGTKPEVKLRKLLSKRGLKCLANKMIADAKVRPDMVFPSERMCVFVDGCFWHGCPACAKKTPSSNKAYWIPKLRENRLRDARQTRKLRRAGWRVVRVWEHELKRSPERALSRIMRVLGKRRPETFHAKR